MKNDISYLFDLAERKNKLIREFNSIAICDNHKLGCDCTNWDEYRIDKERKNNA